MTNDYDYVLDCPTLASLLPLQTDMASDVIVTHWRGTEAISRLYRFDITVAVKQRDLALEKLLNQRATLKATAPDGSPRSWHGIITQIADQGHDDVFFYYQLVLEPRMARLRAMRWSDIYLKRDLADLIKQLLAYADLTEPYSSSTAAYDYRILATSLTQTQSDFTCQFEETCLDFLMRKLEHYGVYFWFDQTPDQESVVFANAVEQQTQQMDVAVYYPKGTIEPDAREVAIVQLNRRVTMPADMYVLHDSQEQANTTLSLSSQARLPKPLLAEALGEFHSFDDHFEQLESETSISGATLASWRAEELACGRMRVEGEAQTPGIRPAVFLSISEYLRGISPRQYFVTEVTHEGSQAVETAPQINLPAYQSFFVALPRYIEIDNLASDPVQYRAPRTTPVPRISRLINGFVDVAKPGEPQRLAQPDDQGRYKIRFLFARQRYDGEQNSAFVRMATPYAGGASSQGLADAGMHFPLREGTEVLLAFVNGNPDRPVIISSLPNTEAPSVVSAKNPSHHRIGTPGGNLVLLADAEGDSEGAPFIHLESPTQNSSLNLGKSEEVGVNDGFYLKTDQHGEMYAGTSLLIEVPGHYRVNAGTDSTSGATQSMTNFLSSEVQGLPRGITAGQSGGIVIENFLGLKIESVEAVKIGHFIGGIVELCEAAKFETHVGATLAVEASIGKEINLVEKNILHDQASYTNLATRWIAAKWNGVLAEKEETVGTSTSTVLEKYTVVTPSAFIGAVGACLTFEPGVATLSGLDATLAGSTLATVSSAVETQIEGSISTLSLNAASAAIKGATVEINGSGGVSVTSFADVTVNGTIVMLG